MLCGVLKYGATIPNIQIYIYTQTATYVTAPRHTRIAVETFLQVLFVRQVLGKLGRARQPARKVMFIVLASFAALEQT